MEAAAFRRSGPGDEAREEKRVEPKSYNKEEIVLKVGNGGTQHENYKKPSSPMQKDLGCIKQELFVTNKEASSLELDSMASSSSRSEQEDQLQSARAEMGEVREENERLKMYLDKIKKDYRNLQMQFYNIVLKEAKKETSDSDQEIEEPELVSLTLGRFSGHHPKKSTNLGKGKESFEDDDDDLNKNLGLGLDSKFQGATDILSNPSPANSFDLAPKEEAVGKNFKTVRSGEDDVSQQIPLKKARVSVRARCDTPTMNDGCQWRKYGQKIAKGNPCPRAYYRCTVAPDCPVRKQVQRCAGDMSILTTTYEGTHNHTLGISATAMASTTSAAASMLMSGSSSSSSGHLGPILHGPGLNFKQFYLPNSSISSSPSHPTITLDLTSTPSSFSSSHLNRFSSSFPPGYSLTNLNFGSSDQSNAMPWGNVVLNYGTSTQIYNRNQSSGTLNLGTENVFQSFGAQDTIADATKAITADPSFQSALAAALSSIIGTGTSSGGSQIPRTAQGISGCASSYVNKVPSTNSQQTAGSMFLPSLSFSTSKSASASPGDNRDQTN